MMNIYEDEAAAWSGQWHIFQLSQTPFMLAPAIWHSLLP